MARVVAGALRTPRRRAAVLGASSGAVLALGAPPLELWVSTPVAIALLALAVREGGTVRRGALAGWLAGTTATLGAFYWVAGTVVRFTPLPLPAAVLAYLLLGAIAGLTLGVAGALAGLGAPALGRPASLALGVLVAERYVPGVFPWQLASPLVNAPWIPQCGDALGVSGLGALLAFALGVLADAGAARLASRAARRAAPTSSSATTGPRRASVAAACAALVAACAYGALETARVRRAMSRAPRTVVALVQPAIPPTVRWDESQHDAILAGLRAQTRAAFAEHASLVVWSEAAYPFLLPHGVARDGEGGPPALDAPAPAPVVLGAITRDAAGRRYNSAMVREPDGSLGAPVSKHVLVPFGEYVPLVGEVPWVRRTFARARGLSPGGRPAVLRTRTSVFGGGRAGSLGLLNCFEDTLPRVGAELARVELLVNITNDAWFGRGPAAHQHLMLARWRAIETRRELVRAVNTGVTCHVDALGRVERAAPTWRPLTLIVEPRSMSMRLPAPYVIVYAPPVAAFVLVAARVGEGVSRRRKARNATG